MQQNFLTDRMDYAVKAHRTKFDKTRVVHHVLDKKLLSPWKEDFPESERHRILRTYDYLQRTSLHSSLQVLNGQDFKGRGRPGSTSQI